MNIKLILTAALLETAPFMYAQQSQKWEEYLQQLNDEEDFQSVSWDEYTDLLTNLSEHPININTATREDLEQLPFLTGQQIEDILAYIYQYGPMKSLGELGLIESLGYYQHKLLEFFVYPGDIKQKNFPSLKNILKYGKSEIIATAKIPFYNRKGDINGYLGYKYKHWIEYKFNYGQYVKFGIVGSQDAGEPFMSHGNYPYDYYSYYFQIRKYGKLKNLTLGRYRLKIGMGLVINTNYSLGKTITLSTLGRNSNNISTHSSRSEANYLQGAAATITVAKGLDWSNFISYRSIDATLDKNGKSIVNFINTGYHRTETEIEKKHNASEFLLGSNLNYFNNGFHIGTTALYTSFDKPLEPKTEQIYRRWYPKGKSFYNMGIDYGYTSHKLVFSGETATGDSHAIATINNLSYMFSGTFSLIALQRFYSYKYYSLYSQSFNAGGSIQDESGLYLGINWHPLNFLNIMAYTDYAYYAWPKYQTSEASHCWDNMLTAIFQLNKYWNINTRYHIKIEQKDNIDKNGLIQKIEQRGRLSVVYQEQNWNNNLQSDINFCQYKQNSFGWMVSDRVTFHFKPIQLAGNIAYFHTRDYYSRIYTYEQSTLYNLSFPSFFGKGIRYCILAKININNHLMLITKTGTTDYFDRNHISSSYQQINHSSQTDLDIQLIWKF